MSDQTDERQAGIVKVTELMKDSKICSLTTMSSSGSLVSRPMALQQVEFDGDLWFFTYDGSNKVGQIQARPETNVAFNNSNSWVSLSGKAEIIHDRAKAEELWNPALKAWFPNGVDEPGMALVKIKAESAEYWDTASNKLTTLFGMAKAAVTGQRHDGGENKTVEL